MSEEAGGDIVPAVIVVQGPLTKVRPEVVVADGSSRVEKVLVDEEDSVAQLPCTTLTSPQPEISLSGSDPEVEEKREVPVLFEDGAGTTVFTHKKSASTPEKTVEPHGFIAEVEPRNDAILEDARKMECSTSCRNSSTSSVIASRRRYSSWPGPCAEKSTSDVFPQDAEEVSKEKIPPDKNEQVINGRALAVQNELSSLTSSLALHDLKNANEKDIEVGEDEEEQTSGSQSVAITLHLESERSSSEEATVMKSAAAGCLDFANLDDVKVEDGCRQTSSVIVSMNSDSTQESYATQGEKFPAAIPVIDCPVPVTCTDSTNPKPAMEHQYNHQYNVQFFQGFHSLEHYRMHHGLTFVHACSENVWNIDFNNMERIGKGSYGVVYQDHRKMFAIKKTRYRHNELTILSKLKHCNIISLLGVALIDPQSSTFCFQIMPKLNCDLYTAYKSFRCDGLIAHLSGLTNHQNRLIISNVVHIFKHVAQGLEYLNENGLYHGDITARNILLRIECECRDGMNDIFCCSCVDKYSVVIADFDSVYSLESGDPHVNMTGTVGFRAPEVCIRHRERTTLGLCRCCPKSDVFGAGAILVWMLHGENCVRKVKEEANSTIRQPDNGAKLTTESEGVFLQLLLSRLAQMECGKDLRFLVTLAGQCLKVDVEDRPAANELLTMLKWQIVVNLFTSQFGGIENYVKAVKCKSLCRFF